MVIPRDRPSFSNRSIEHDVLPFSWQHGIGVLAWSPRASGFLVDSFDLQSLDPQDFRRRHPYAQEPAYTKLIRVRKMLQDIAQDHHKRLIDLSIA
jgi:aryl-alcohol dehydrogenase-like predicted oxidoreductase